MASGPITSWQIDGEIMKTVTNFIFGASKITADGDCSYEIKRCLLLGRKVMTNLDSILKSRDITLLTKVHLVKAMVFPVVMYGCDVRFFSDESVLCIRWPKYWSFSFNISPSNEHPGLISFRMDWLDLLADYQESSPTPQFKSINSFNAQPSSQSNSHIRT